MTRELLKHCASSDQSLIGDAKTGTLPAQTGLTGQPTFFRRSSNQLRMTSRRWDATRLGADHQEPLAIGRDVELVKVARVVLGQVQQLHPLAQHQALRGLHLHADEVVAGSIKELTPVARPHRAAAAAYRDCHPVALARDGYGIHLSAT